MRIRRRGAIRRNLSLGTSGASGATEVLTAEWIYIILVSSTMRYVITNASGR
jgi:hypothetical protein